MIRAFVVAAAAAGAIAGVAIGSSPVAAANVRYKNCTGAAEDGRYNIASDDPAYGPWLDSDHDGIGCEKR
jgi:hypothetical protein